MTEKIENLKTLFSARNEFIFESKNLSSDIYKQTLKAIDTIIAQRCYEICEEFNHGEKQFTLPKK